MNLADVNVLIGAFRSDIAAHPACLKWLRDTIDSAEPFAVSTLALAAVVRITTQTKFFPSPSPLADALGFCDDIVGQPACRIVLPGTDHWGIFRQLVLNANARAKLAADAYYAALAIEHGCEWVTLDKDFGRFKGLKWRLLK